MTVKYIFKKIRFVWRTMISAIVLLLACQCSDKDLSGESIETLKQVIADRDSYLTKKLNQIDSVQNELHAATDANAQFDASRRLFEMYYDLQIDKALQYAEHMLELSEGALGHLPQYRTEALFLIARVYAYAGMYKKCGELLDSTF